jgi:predicted metalloprotease with PDZ domain
VRGRDEINYNEILQNFGLRLDSTVPNAAPRASLGANMRQQGDFLSVAVVPAGTPAYEQGLNTGDLIVALDGIRIANQNDLTARLGERKPGDKIRLTVFRFDEMRDLPITLGGRTPENYRFVAAPNATAEQQRLLQSWLGAESR